MTIKINQDKKSERIPDYKSPIVLTQMIPSERRGEAPKGGVFENTDFEKNREYFHILPHDEPHALRRKVNI